MTSGGETFRGIDSEVVDIAYKSGDEQGQRQTGEPAEPSEDMHRDKNPFESQGH